jgi:hypothetical protein
MLGGVQIATVGVLFFVCVWIILDRSYDIEMKKLAIGGLVSIVTAIAGYSYGKTT